MLIKIAVLGALGYAGYKLFQSADTPAGASAVRLAGGPLSKHARVQRTADAPRVRGDVLR